MSLRPRGRGGKNRVYFRIRPVCLGLVGGRLPSCSPRFWWPTAARSRSAPSAPPTSSAPQTVAVFPYEDRNSDAPAQGRRGVPDRRAGAPGPGLPRPPADRGDRGAGRRRRHLPRLRLPVGEPGPGRGVRRRRASPSSVPAAGVLDPDRQQGARDRRRPGGGRADAASVAPGTDVDALIEEALDPPLPRLREGGGRGRRPRHAPGRRAGRPARGDRGLHARGGGGVRRPGRLHRAGRRRARATSRCRSWPTRPAA